MCARQKSNPWLAPLLAALGMLLGSTAGAQVIGEVEFARGVGFAQTAGQNPRTLGKGLQLSEGDRLTTSDSASAIIKLQDGSRMTVRPGSEIVISQYQFKGENSPDNAMLMQLVRGGFRAITGLISKGSPNAARVQTNTATIGIRGTDFDARLCSRDCGNESSKIDERARPNAVLASAKMITVTGEVSAVDASGSRRRLSDGGGIYPGDVIETAASGRAVMAFRDDSRITLGPNSRFRVDNFVYDEQNAGEGRFLMSVLKGSVRALTGLIAKANTRNVGFSTVTATIGVRGTGLDIECTGPCAGEEPAPGQSATSGLSLYAWLGAITVTPQGTTALQVLQAGQGLFIHPQLGVRPINVQPPSQMPRPDQVTVPPKLFAKAQVSDAEQGLFVFVRDGNIAVSTAGDVLHLGKGEAGFANQGGETKRPVTIPKFIDFDKTPQPNTKNPLLVSVLQDAGVKSANQCK